MNDLTEKWLDRIQLVGAGLLYASALKYFVLPSKVILTGSEGIATAVAYYFDSYVLFIGLYLIFQAILLGFAYWKLGKVFANRSLLVVATVLIGLTLLPTLTFAQPEPQNERIILVIFGGLLAGFAKAIAFQKRGSTGVEDILGAYFAMKYLRPVGVIAVFAAVVSTSLGMALDLLKTGAFEMAVNTLMYTCIYIFASTETLNNLYHKFKITMLVVITPQEQKVCAAIKNTSQHRTYTIQKGTGGHHEREVTMVRTIVTREELPAILAAVQQADPSCFYYHHDVEGVSRRYYITPIA